MAPKTKHRRQETTQHLCRICNIWIADNKLQRDQHESGAKHIANRQKLLRQIAEQNEKARALARKEGRNTESGGRAAQDLMEIAAQATQGQILEPKTCTDEKTDVEKSSVEDVGQQLDEKGYPMAANSLFEWTAVTDEGNEDEESQEQEQKAEALEQSAQQTDMQHFVNQGARVKRTFEEEEDINTAKGDDVNVEEERTEALSSFKKRSSAAGRKRRRRR